MTFTVTTASEAGYDFIMKYLMSSALNFTKTQHGGSTSFKIIGSQAHYDYFDNEIKSGRLNATIDYF